MTVGITALQSSKAAGEPRETLRTSTAKLHLAASEAFAAGALHPKELLKVRQLLKRGRPSKMLSRQREDHLIGERLTFATELSGRVAALRSTVPVPVNTESTPASTTEPATVEDGESQAPRRVDELSSVNHELLASKYRLVCLVEQGRPIKDAIRESAFLYSERTARETVKRYREQGPPGLVDGRWSRVRRDRPKMTPEVQRAVLSAWFAAPAAGPKAIWRVTARHCTESGLPVPKYHSVWRLLAGQLPGIKALRAGRLQALNKEMTSVVRFTMARHANERFQIDHTQLDIWVREERESASAPLAVWCTAVMDEYSRTVAAFILSTRHPDAWTVALTLRHAIMPKRHPLWLNKGIPKVLQPDRGRDFMSNAVATSCAQLGIRIDPDPPYYPNRKGKIERWFQTLDTGCLRVLPGHKVATGTSEGSARRKVDLLLTLAQLRSEIERWIVEDYHQRPHRELQASPHDCWSASVGIPRLPDSDDALLLLLMQTDVRVVQNVGIEFRGERYWAPELQGCIKMAVRLRYDPDDAASVFVYSATAQEFICEAIAMGHPDSRFVTADVQRVAREYRRGLSERMREHANAAVTEGRRQAEAKKAAILAESLLAQANSNCLVLSGSDQDVERLISRLDDIDAGRSDSSGKGG